MERPQPGRDWIAVSEAPIPLGDVVAWTMQPGCGAVVTFCGTVRDHSEGRSGVVSLEYEAYMEQVEPSLCKVAGAARSTWGDIGRLALLHRVGRLQVGEVSVVVAVSTPHRAEAFEAARFCIDTVKESVPIWKRETWADGSAWALCSHDFVELERDDHSIAAAAEALPSVGS
jgi:molybdopterin synthase catalytic subunit